MNYDPARMVAFDCETHLIQDGLLAPPLVCASVAGANWPAQLLDKTAARSMLAHLLAPSTNAIIVGANIAYDLLVMAVDAARRGESLIEDIFRAYDEGRIFDVQIAESLHAVAGGHLGRHPDGSPLRDAKGRVTNRYSLDTCVKLVLGRDNAKVNDRWRLRYHELEHTPISEWPEDAKIYPVDDAVNTLEVALVQVGALGPYKAGGPNTTTHANTPDRVAPAARRNLHDHAAQVYKAWCLHLGAAWGVRTDPTAVDVLEAAARELASRGVEDFKRAGFVREDGSEDSAVVKRAVALAYGCSGTCAACGGTGKIHTKFSVKDPTKPVGKPINCAACSATGLDLSSAPVPRTAPTDKFPAGQVQAGRDVLIESGDEFLAEYGYHQEDDKILSTYVPFLREGVRAPICLRPNPVLETARVSYSGPIQLLPRQVSARLAALLRERGGPVGVRDCIIPPAGRVFFSVDYSGGELVTFAEAATARVGFSKMGEALNAGQDVHSLLGGQFVGMSYDDFMKRRKETRLKNLRQAAKPINFGCPGGIGAPKIVLQQRKQGPDTPCPSGPSTVWDSDARAFVPGYKGLRFCILVEGAEVCGAEKVIEWGRAGYERPIPPTCKQCIQVAERLRRGWFDAWPEAKPYLDWHARNADRGGVVEQLYSRRIRGGLDFCSEANGDFQALLADIMGRAYCRMTKGAYTDRSSPLWDARIPVFAHDEAFGDAPAKTAAEAAGSVAEIMVEEFRKGCPNHAAACKAEPALAHKWFKAMEPVYVDGRLVPWEPERRAA